MKCSICKKKVQETFLEKIIGTYVKDKKGKKHPICFECQKKYQDKDKLLDNIK